MRGRRMLGASQQALIRNVRFAFRALRRSPAFALTALTTLALAIGANTAVYSVVDAVLLRPLPYPAADRVVHVMQTKEGSPATWLAAPRLEDWNGQNATFEAITGYAVEDTADTTGDVAERVRRARVAPRLLEVWGVRPALGRGFDEGEYLYGGPTAVLISDRYWRQRFSADRDVLSKEVRLGGRSYPVVGVMPASFRFPEQDVDLWIPEAVNNPFRQRRQ